MCHFKKCSDCKLRLPSSEFYRHPETIDGFLGKCKECHKIAVRKARTINIVYYRAFDRERAMLPHRVAARLEYKKTSKGAAIERACKANWIKRNPFKRAAQIVVGNAIRDGRLTRKPCVRCGRERAHAHHEDYTRPLAVTWLCPKHHTARHKEIGRQE